MAQNIRDLAREIFSLKRQVRALSLTPQLGHSTVDGGAIVVTDGGTVENPNGTTTVVVGAQPDGTNGAVVVTGPPPPTPSKPTLRATAGGIIVTWDGLFYDEATVTPLDFARVEIHASTDPAFVAGLIGQDSETLKGTIESPRGGEVVLGGLSYETHYVVLVTRSLAGKFSAASEIAWETPSQVGFADIADGSVTTVKIADGAVQGAKIADEAITGVKLAEGSVLEGKLADAAVTLVKVAHGAIDKDRLAANAVTMGKVAPGAITEGAIADFAVAVKKFKTTTHQIY